MARNQEQEAFEDNKVYLWGITQASKELLDIYDKGNKNPFSVVHQKKKMVDTRIKPDEAQPKNKYNKNNTYDINDINFLHNERTRIIEEQEDVDYGSEEDDKLQEDLDAIEAEIARLEKLKQEEEEKEWNKKDTSIDDKYKELDDASKEYKEHREALITKFKKNVKGLDMESNEYKKFDDEKDILSDKLLKDYEAKKKEIDTKYSAKPVKKESKKGKGTNMHTNQPVQQYTYIGQGFKAGSPEAKAHAEKMRLAREAKKAPKVEVEVEEVKPKRGNASKKGTEEMRARMAELNRVRSEKARAKKEAETKEKEAVKEKKIKPWFYIGDIPKGYREATEEEAILKNMVSPYGKYKVDYNLWFFWDKYHINISKNQPDMTVTIGMSSAKRQIKKIVEDMIIIKNKLQNPKHYSSQNVLEAELEDKKDDFDTLVTGYNYIKKIHDTRSGATFHNEKFELPDLTYEKAGPQQEYAEVKEEKKKWGKRDIQKLTTKFNRLDLDTRAYLQKIYLDKNDYEGLEKYLNELEESKKNKKEMKVEQLKEEVPEIAPLLLLKFEVYNGKRDIYINPDLSLEAITKIREAVNKALDNYKPTNTPERKEKSIKKEKKNKSLYKKEIEHIKLEEAEPDMTPVNKKLLIKRVERIEEDIPDMTPVNKGITIQRKTPPKEEKLMTMKTIITKPTTDLTEETPTENKRVEYIKEIYKFVDNKYIKKVITDYDLESEKRNDETYIIFRKYHNKTKPGVFGSRLDPKDWRKVQSLENKISDKTFDKLLKYRDDKKYDKLFKKVEELLNEPKKEKKNKSPVVEEEKIEWTEENKDQLLDDSEKYEDKMTPADYNLTMKYVMEDNWDELYKLVKKYKK